MKQVAIVEYGMGNLDSVARAIEKCGGQPLITYEAADFASADAIVLPGVGAFPVGMDNIRARGLDHILASQVFGREVPFLGICLGMQLLAEKGWEGSECEGLGWIAGEVKRLEPQTGDRIPHVGWNQVNLLQPTPLLAGIPSGQDFYFVHSYHFDCRNPQDRMAQTPYCGGFTSIVGRNNLWGVQFHPEKSQRLGFQLLKNFLQLG